MREIKFRGKSIIEDEWLVGYIEPYTEKFAIMHCLRQSKEGFFYTRRAIVKKESVGLYTGLKDKNTVEIFEGDIVRFYDDLEDVMVDGIVKYQEDVCAFMIESKVTDQLFFNPVWEYEVVGNIHERKEQ